MFSLTQNDQEIIRSVIRFRVVLVVVNQFSRIERSTNFVRCDQSMLVDVAATVRHRMIWPLHQDVTVVAYRPAALPVGILFERLSAFPTHLIQLFPIAL